MDRFADPLSVWLFFSDIMATQALSVYTPCINDDQRDMVVGTVSENDERAVAALFGDDVNDMEFDAAAISKARPDAGTSGIAMRCMLLTWKPITASDGAKMVMMGVMIIDSMPKALTPSDAKNGLSSMHVLNENAAYIRVDARYTLTEEDKTAIKGRGIKLAANRKKGNVSVGVRPLQRGAVLRTSLYNVESLVDGEEPVTAGAIIELIGVSASVEWNGREYDMTPAIRPGKYKVVKNDDSNGQRLSHWMDVCSLTPPLDLHDFVTPQLREWPATMAVIRSEMPAPPASGVAAGGAKAIEAPPAAVLSVPERPVFFPGAGDPVIVHAQENAQQTQARLAATRNLPLTVPTRVVSVVPSTDDDAFMFEKEEGGQKLKRSRAKFALAVLQYRCDHKQSTFVHCVMPTGVPIEMFTATSSFKIQQTVLPAMVAGLAGPVHIEPKTGSEHEFDIPQWEDAANMSSYVSVVPPRVAQLTVRSAGLMVSPRYMQIERAVYTEKDARENAFKMASQCAYWAVDGDPKVSSMLFQLNTVRAGYYSEDSDNELVRTFAEKKAVADSTRRQIATDMLDSLTGPLKKLGDTHDFFVVGSWVLPAAVVAHQRALAFSDPVKLMAGNEQLLLKKTVPDDFPQDIYETMIQSSQPPARLGHYALHKSVTSDTITTERMRRQLDAVVCTKKPMITDGSD